MSVKPQALLSPRRGCVGERLPLVMTALGEILTKLATEPRSHRVAWAPWVSPVSPFFFFCPRTPLDPSTAFSFTGHGLQSPPHPVGSSLNLPVCSCFFACCLDGVQAGTPGEA